MLKSIRRLFGELLAAYKPPKPKPLTGLEPPRGRRATKGQVNAIVNKMGAADKLGGNLKAGTPAAIIAANAHKFGLDPAAVLAYALEESNARWGAVGDSGYSYGPFQAHGQSPWGPGAAGNRSPAEAKAWATSPRGLIEMMRIEPAGAGAVAVLGTASPDELVQSSDLVFGHRA